MSRRPPNPAAERAAKNQQTIKSLLKLEANKICADCKRNKHPRWASWNLGVFVCIRCSGIHRGMGTHISRVKSVDLDSWTDEQLQSILSWGNTRANKYWESKLAAGHMPSEAKIENFIRTKYELKRWVMDGPKPDPATLDVGDDDDVPLSVVKEKQNVERRESVRKASVGASSAPSRGKTPAQPAPQADLIGGDDQLPPQRSSSAAPSSSQIPPKAEPAPPKQTSTKDSLLGLDFFGEPAAPPRPASTTGAGVGAASSRPDLKQSILSLYATAPRPQAQPQQNTQSNDSFGSLASPGASASGHQSQSSFGGMNDAFSNLSFGNTNNTKPAAPDPFASFGSQTAASKPAPQSSSAFGGLGGGSFFDSKPAAPPSHQKQPSNSGGLGGFSWSTTSPPPVAAASPPAVSKPAQQTPSSAMDDLFGDFAAPPSNPTPPQQQQKPTSPPAPSTSSVFNLSAQPPKSEPAAPAPAPAPAATSNPLASNLSGADVWGSSAWGDPSPAPAAAAAEPPKPTMSMPSIPSIPTASTAAADDFGGWGSNTNSSGAGAGGGLGGFSANTSIVPGASGGFSTAPKVAADEEFGGWSSSTGPTGGNGGAKPAGGSGGGFGGSDDLFSNVWQ